MQIDVKRFALFVAGLDHWLHFSQSSVNAGYTTLRLHADVTHQAIAEKLWYDDPPAEQLDEALCKANSA